MEGKQNEKITKKGEVKLEEGFCASPYPKNKKLQIMAKHDRLEEEHEQAPVEAKTPMKR